MTETTIGVKAEEGLPEIKILKFAEGKPQGGNRSGIFYFKDNSVPKGHVILPIYVTPPAEDNRFDGVQLAEKLVKEIDAWNTAPVKSLKENWNYVNEGTEVKFTSKIGKSYNLEMWIESMPGSGQVEWDYSVENIQEGKDAFGGVKQVNTLNVKASVYKKGSINVTFNDGLTMVTKAIQIDEKDTGDSISGKIAEAFSNLNDWDVIKDENSGTIIFTAKETNGHRDVTVTIM